MTNYQQQLAKNTSVYGLLSADTSNQVAQVLDENQRQPEPQDVEVYGLIGFDVKNEQFVVLSIKQKSGSEQTGKDLSAKQLSVREREVLQLVAWGSSNAQIAQKLVISQNTVKVHIRNIFEKLQVQCRTEAAMIAVRRGWVKVMGARETEVQLAN
jgi:DNA-binding NarL/FixJ family response regulator